VVQRLVALGMTRHERVLRFAAFCGARAWVASPRVARLYVSEIVEMCTHTNHLDDFNSLAQWRTLSDKQLALETQSAPPAAAAAAAGGDDAPSPLMERFDPIYTAVWARARQPTFEGHALASPELRRLIAESVNQNPAASRLVSTESVVRCSLLLVMETLARREPRDAHSGALLRDLLRAGFASFPRLVHHFTPANAPNEGSTVHTRTLYLLQMLCVLVGGLDAAAAAEGESLPRLLEWTHDELWRVYDRNPFTTARHEIEMMLINVLRREPARLFPRALMARLRDLTARPVAKASAMLVAGFALRFAARPVDREALFLPVVQEMFPLLSSNFGYVRAIAQYFIHDLICACAPGVAAAAAAAGKAKEEEEEEKEQEAKEEAAAAAASALGVSAQQFVVNTFRFLTVYPDTVKSRLRQEEYFARFDPLKRCTVAGILGDATDDRHYVPRPLIEAARAGLSEVLNSFRAEDEVLSRVDAAYRGIAAAAGSGQQQPAQAAAAEAAAAAAGAGAAAPSFFQKKAVPLDYLFEEGGESAADDETRRARFETERAARRREPLVVCASLLDKAPNLAGLTRTCEVFNAELLTVGDRAILESDLYVRAAVSAHKWMPVQEVPPAQIASFLAAMRAKGYKVVALEQAANSVPLERFVFPEKMVLLLGQERQGTPVELLSLVDACVEIPQFGVIRSLNVHVSASILIWERTRQRLLAGKLAK
jgi:tRNA(Leu) C34 or U34 (ribose-2'-O)-methylase TrmL